VTIREMRKLEHHERDRVLREAARRFDRALNLFGEEIDDLVEAAWSLQGDDIVERKVARLLLPDCHHRKGTCSHDYPAWFCREARPAATAFLQVARQYRRAEGIGRK
jgi:hypothetical protein